MIVIGFNDDSKAYHALATLKRLDAEGRIGLRSAVVVKREEDGRFHVADAASNEAVGAGAFTGGLIGSFVGILGGPLGVLLGWSAGSLIGLASDRSDVREGFDLYSSVADTIPANSTGLLAEVWEPAVEVIDSEAASLGGTVIRRRADEIRVEIMRAEEAQRAAEKEARRVMREERREAFKDKVEDVVESVKDVFDRD